MKVTFKTGSEVNYGSTNGELFFASNTKQIMLNGIKYIPKKLSELTNDSGFISSITKSMVEGVLTGNITSHTHSYLPLTGGTLTGNLTCNGSYITMSSSSGAKGYSGYFNNPKRSDRASYSHILGDGYAYGTNAISIGAAAYAGIRNTDSDSGTYPYLHWQWMNCLQVKEVTSAGDVNCYGAILNNLGGTKDTAKFTVCVDGVCKFYDENKGDNDPTNQFLKFTNTDANYGRVVVFVVDTGDLIFGGNTSHPRNMCNLRIGDMLLGRGCCVKNIASMTINGKTVYRLAIYWWSGKLSPEYDITKATTAMVCTKVNSSDYSGNSSVASGNSSVASGYYSIASGDSSVASGLSSIASGAYSIASGNYSVASGNSSIASGAYSVASGNSSVASGNSSIASGHYSVASGYCSVAIGHKSKALKFYDFVSGYRCSSNDYFQTVIGRTNAPVKGAFVIGNGSIDNVSDDNAVQSNCFVVDWSGNVNATGAVTATSFNGSLNGTAANASKLATPRKIKVGSTSKSFDGSGDIEFALNSIITQSDTINVGTINVAEQLTTKNITIGNHLSISSGADISGLTPSMIGAAEASHNHDTTYLKLSGGTMSNTNLVTNLNADLLDGYNASSLSKIAAISLTLGQVLRIDMSSHKRGLLINAQGTNAGRNALYFVTGYGDGTTERNDIRVIKGGPYNIYFNGTSEKGCVYIVGTLSYGNDEIYINPFDYNYVTCTIVSSVPSDAVLVSSYNGNTLATLNSNVASSSKWATARTITLTGSVTGSVSIDGSANVSLDTTTNHTHIEYLPLVGGTLTGALTVPTLTSTGGILLGDSSLSAMVGSIGIQRYDETGFIGFLKDFNLDNSFNGVVLGWDGNYSLQENSVRINASTFTYKGNNVWHSGNLKLGYISSSLSRAVQKDTNGNLYIVAPSLFEQGISNNYPKNLRWSNEIEGQLVYDKEIEAGNFDTVEIGIPLANGTSKGFMKSISTVTNVTGYTPCPVVSGTPYYKLDTIELDYTDFLEIGSGNIESHLPITIKVQEGGSLKYLFDYTVDNIPRLLTISEGNFCKYFFWLQQTDDDTPIVAYYHCQFNDLWLVIDSPNMEVRISQGSF